MIQAQLLLLPTSRSVERPLRLVNGIINGLEGQPQHLYFTTDEEIKEGDYCVAYQTILSNNNQNHYIRESYIDIVIFTERKIKTSGRYDTIDCKKIVASTDPSLGLPAIPQSFLQDYVKNNGKIDSVWLETNNMLHGCIYEDRVEYDKQVQFNKSLKFTDNNEVIVVDDHLDQILSIFADNDMQVATHNTDPIDVVDKQAVKDQELEHARHYYLTHMPHNVGLEQQPDNNLAGISFKAGYKAAKEKLANQFKIFLDENWLNSVYYKWLKTKYPGK